MEIRNWNWYIVLNCAVIPFLAAKPFSLNEALAAESKLKTSEVSLPVSTEPTAHRFSLRTDLNTETPKKQKLEKLLRGISTPPKFNKGHHFKSVLQTKKPRHILKPFYSRRNLSRKREAYKNDKDYLPILKNLGLLLDNLLNSQPVESYEVSKSKQKRHKYQPEEKRGIVCKCALQSDPDVGESRTYKKTAPLPKVVSTESPPTTTTTPDPPMGDVSGIRQNKDLSLLLPRDPPSHRRNVHGHREGSRPALHGSLERNIPRNLRNSKHYSRYGDEDEDSSAAGYEKAAHGHPRDYASSDEHKGRQNRRGNVPIERRAASKRKTFEEDDDEANSIFGGDSIEEYTRETQLKVRPNKTKGEKFIPEHGRRLRRPVPETEDGDIAEPVPSKEDNEKSFNDVAFDNTSDKRISNRGSPSSAETKEASPRNEDMISLKDLSNLNLALHKSPKIETPSVTIIDGYSVARDKNGQNKLSEKTIHIHT